MDITFIPVNAFHLFIHFLNLLTMTNDFIPGAIYNAAQTISIFSLSNNHFPIYYTGLVFVATHKDENGLIEHEFNYEGESRFFDDAFTNNGKSFDNSMVIVERIN